jgi:hypothetical protein
MFPVSGGYCFLAACFSTKTWINDLKQFDKNVFSAIDADIFKLKDPKDSIVLTDDYLNNV